MLKNKKYKIILSISIMLITVIYVLLLCMQNMNQEISNYYIEENILNEPGILYVQLEDDKNHEDIVKNYQTGQEPYFIKVNYKAQTVTIYEKDKNGYYSIPLKAMICSTRSKYTKRRNLQNNKFQRRMAHTIWRSLWTILYSNCWEYIISFSSIF